MNYQKPDPMLNLTKQAIEAGVEGAARVGAIPPAGAQARPDANMLDQLQEAWQRYGKNLSIGGGIGALLGGGTSAMVGGSRGETPAERRRRILRVALVGGAFGAGAGVALPAAADAFSTAAPAASKAEQSAQAFANQFRPDKPLGSGWASMSMGAGGLGGSSWLRGRSALGKMDAKVREVSNSFIEAWHNEMAAARQKAVESLNTFGEAQAKYHTATNPAPSGDANLRASQAVDRITEAHRTGALPLGMEPMPGGVRLTGPQRSLGVENSAVLDHMRPMLNRLQTTWGDMDISGSGADGPAKTINEHTKALSAQMSPEQRQIEMINRVDKLMNSPDGDMLSRMSARKPGMLNATKRILFPSSGRTHVYNGPNRASEFKAPMGWGGRAAGALGFALPFLSHYVTPMAPKIPEIVKATFDGVSPE